MMTNRKIRIFVMILYLTGIVIALISKNTIFFYAVLSLVGVYLTIEGLFKKKD